MHPLSRNCIDFRYLVLFSSGLTFTNSCITTSNSNIHVRSVHPSSSHNYQHFESSKSFTNNSQLLYAPLRAQLHLFQNLSYSVYYIDFTISLTTISISSILKGLLCLFCIAHSHITITILKYLSFSLLYQSTMPLQLNTFSYSKSCCKSATGVYSIHLCRTNPLSF